MIFSPSHKAFALILLGIVSLAVSACGKQGGTRPPGPASEVTYPRVYPSE